MNKILGVLFFAASNLQAQPAFRTVGVFERYDVSVNMIVSDSAKAEVISEGYSWTEGPLWVARHHMLLFSDVPNNAVYKWTAAEGTRLYLKPSGFSGESSKSRETGSNGLTLDPKGNLVLCQHGNRQMAVMNAPLTDPQPGYTALATHYRGKRFSSPNDCVFNDQGEFFFTDPPYGLPTQGDKDPLKELSYNGVYKVKKDGTVILLVDSITRPNGIAFFPGYKKILVACSDPQKPNWYVFDVKGDSLTNGGIFYSVAGYDKKLSGLPDGLKIDSKGNVFATGPGGLYIFNKQGKLLGRLSLPEPTSNCSLSADERTLFITNNKQVLKFSMR